MKIVQLASAIQRSLTRHSIASLVFNIMANVTVASAQELKQAQHFWYDSEDRDIPSAAEFNEPKVQMSQIAGESFRRKLRKGLCGLTFCGFSLVCSAIYLFGLASVALLGPDRTVARLASASTESTHTNCDDLRKEFIALRGRRDSTVPADPKAADSREEEIRSQFNAKNCK